MITKLNAVNQLLQSIGEKRVNSLNESYESDLALSVIEQTSRKVQTKGWFFNKEKDYTYTPDADNFINIPSNIISIDLSSESSDYVQRGTQLYNKATHSYEFEDSITADIIIELEFERLPVVAQEHIIAKASYEFQKQTMGNTNLLELALVDINETLIALNKEELKNGDYNMLNRQG